MHITGKHGKNYDARKVAPHQFVCGNLLDIHTAQCVTLQKRECSL